MATLTKEQYAQLKGQGKKNYIPQTTGQQTVITADKFIGELQGNASTASALDHAITLSLGGDASGSVQINANNARLNATIYNSAHADNADTAENANHSAQASHADLANIATLALRSMLADNATHADRASNADNADHSDDATHADSADSATRATYDSNGDNIHNTFVDKQRQITANTNTITGHSSTLVNHEERLGTAENKIDNLDTRVDNIETSTDVGQLTIRVVNIEDKNLEQDNRLDAINDSMVTLTTAQYVSGIKRFNQSKVEMSNDPIGIDVTNKDYVDNKTLSSSQWVKDWSKDYTDNRILSSSNYVTDVAKEYTDNRILSSSQYVDDHFMSLTKSQYVTGLNTFEQLPQSEAVPANANDLITKQYFEENQSSGHTLFDVVPKDHVLTYGKDLEGFAPLGTWVYKDAVDGSRYGYPDFVQKCLDEYEEATADTITADSVTLNIKQHSNGHIYFDVADIETVNTYFNTYGHAWFYGIDETNERVFLPRQAHGKLIESYKNGRDWYRIYEDGWCEQGGGHDTYVAGAISVNFLKAYKEIPYCSFGIVTNRNGNGYDKELYPNTLTLNGFTSTNIGSTSGTWYRWYACGYIDISNLQIVPIYEYMVVGNVKVEQASTDVIDVTTTNNDTVPLFTAHYFDYTPNNLSWLKSGEQSNSAELYKTCYNELVNVLNGETKYGSLKVIDESDMVEEEDYSLYWIVDQVNETFRTPTKTQQRFVVKTWKNGNDWYRIYNDGWCEQGGKAVDSASGVTVTLLKPYLNTDYTINLSTKISGSGSGLSSTCWYDQTATSFTIRFDYVTADRNVGGDWSTCGYIDLTNETFDTSLYFKVANAVENVQMLDVGEVTEALSGKVDKTNTEWATNACMPDYSAGVSLAQLTTNEQTFTMDDNGFLAFTFYQDRTSDYNGYIKVNDNLVCYGYAYSTNVGNTFSGVIPVNKNDIIKYRSSSATVAYINLVFYPCRGV